MVAIKMDEDIDDDLFGTTSEKKVRKQNLNQDEEVPYGEVEFLHDVPLNLKAQVGSVQKSVRDLLALKAGSIVEYDKVVGDTMDILIGGRLMCRGDIVVVNERYGIRITEVIRAEDSARETEEL